MSAVRWLYHAVTRERWESASTRDVYGPADAHGEGAPFIHASYRDVVVESARLYLPAGSAVVVVRIDPRRLGGEARVEIAETPRGPMPHIHGGVPREAIAQVVDLEQFARDVARAPDDVADVR